MAVLATIYTINTVDFCLKKKTVYILKESSLLALIINRPLVKSCFRAQTIVLF